jgi:LAO/AO transport system kinase
MLERGGAGGRAVAVLAYRSGRESATVGLTGAPGSGKSTLTDGLIQAARADGVDQLGVVAVDPSSPFTGGAILGDRVRMQARALDPGV